MVDTQRSGRCAGHCVRVRVPLPAPWMGTPSDRWGSSSSEWAADACVPYGSTVCARCGRSPRPSDSPLNDTDRRGLCWLRVAAGPDGRGDIQLATVKELRRRQTSHP